jgi:hypothetical protein
MIVSNNYIYGFEYISITRFHDRATPIYKNSQYSNSANTPDYPTTPQRPTILREPIKRPFQKGPDGSDNSRVKLLTSGLGTTKAEEMAKPIINDELRTPTESLLPPPPPQPRLAMNPGRLPLLNRATDQHPVRHESRDGSGAPGPPKWN